MRIKQHNLIFFLLSVLLLISLQSFCQSDSLMHLIVNPKVTIENKYDAYRKLKEANSEWSPEVFQNLLDTALIAQKNDDDYYKAMFYYEKAQLYYYAMQEFNNALIYYNKAIEIQRKLDDKENLAKSLTNAGNAYQYMAQLKIAANYYQEALNIFEQLNNKYGQRILVNNLGVIYQQQGNYTQAINYYFKVLKMAEDDNDTVNIAMDNANIGTAYFDNGEFELSRKFMSEAARLYKSLKDSTNLTNCFINLGNIAAHTNDYDKALEYYNKSKNISTQQSNELNLAYSLYSIAGVYLTQNKPEKALKLLIRSIAIYSKKNNINDLLKAQAKLAEAYLLDKQFEQAEQTALKALELSKQNGITKKTADIYLTMSNIHKAQNKGMQALMFAEKHHALRDSVFNLKTEQTIQELNVLYETEKKEQQIVQLKQDKLIEQMKANRKLTLVLVLAILLFFIVIILILISRLSKIKSFEREARLNQKLLRAQMNPHFIFNSLNSVNHYITLNKSADAGYYLTRFAKLMRNILDGSMHEYVSLEQEIDNITAYLELEKLRFQNKFDYQILVSDEIDKEEIELPPMLVQPFIENAIIHGLKPIEKDGLVQIIFNCSGKNSLICQIIDNGIGIEQSEKKKAHTSYAMRITNERLKLINKKHKKGIMLQVVDLKTKNMRGTKVEITIPL